MKLLTIPQFVAAARTPIIRVCIELMVASDLVQPMIVVLMYPKTTSIITVIPIDVQRASLTLLNAK